MNRLFLFFFIIVLGCFQQSFAVNSTLPYDYSDTHSVPIKLSIVEPISTKDGLLEGSKLKFKVKDDVKYNGQLILKKDTVVTGVLETVVPRGMNGFPAEIIVDNFEVAGISNSKLISTYTKKGQNRCLWVYPLKWALTPIPFVGSTTNFILGGHAKIKKSDVITIYYYPNWK
ncbi:hypothetical protein IJE86_10040 [bacterium]|nr:hypothetical protein [bacterium]